MEQALAIPPSSCNQDDEGTTEMLKMKPLPPSRHDNGQIACKVPGVALA